MAVEEQAKQKTRVLVLDDERLIADTLSIILNQTGFEAMPAYGGESALDLAKEFRPDVLISDLILGDSTGIDIAVQMRGQFPGLRVLLLSGQIGSSHVQEAATAHGFTLLQKPMTPGKLLEQLRS